VLALLSGASSMGGGMEVLLSMGFDVGGRDRNAEGGPMAPGSAPAADWFDTLLLGGPLLGGGGVALLAVASCAPPFLLIHFFRSGSYTKLFSSPSLALIGLLGAEERSPDSFLPPNQPPNQPPFFAAAESLSRWASASAALRKASSAFRSASDFCDDGLSAAARLARLSSSSSSSS
jgi:hypothetical protein